MYNSLQAKYGRSEHTIIKMWKDVVNMYIYQAVAPHYMLLALNFCGVGCTLSSTKENKANECTKVHNPRHHDHELDMSVYNTTIDKYTRKKNSD